MSEFTLSISASPSPVSFSTGSHALDRAIANGFPRGEIAEVFGPPGSGKTQLALQVAANALKAGSRVFWIDTSYNAGRSRLASLVGSDHANNLRLVHFDYVPRITVLFGRLFNRARVFPPPDTALLVIDNIGTAYHADFPPGMDNSPWIYSRDFHKKRGTQIERLATALDDIARRNCAVLVLNQMITCMAPGVGLLLTPLISTKVWHSALSTRLFLHRDDVNPKINEREEVRFCQLVKAQGKNYENTMRGPVVTFRIGKHGILDVVLGAESHPKQPSVDTSEVNLQVGSRSNDFSATQSTSLSEGWNTSYETENPKSSAEPDSSALTTRSRKGFLNFKGREEAEALPANLDKLAEQSASVEIRQEREVRKRPKIG